AELKSIKQAKTYSVVRELPKGRTAIGCKWVLRRKFNVDDGSVARKKARLVIKGYEQRYGFDYFSTFASVVRYTTLRYLLAKAAAEDLEINQLDVDIAFLNPELKEEIYMEVPEHFFILEPKLKDSYKRKKFYLRLHKSLYGLKQAPHDPDQISLYQQITGSLLYLVNCTRLELCWQVGQLARFMTSPSADHLRVAKEILRYLAGTITIGILYCGPPKFDVYSDASYGIGKDRTSYLGWITIDYGGAISWSSQKLKSTAQSTMEAEFVAA